MSHFFDYSRDAYYFPVDVPSDGNQIVVDEQDGQGGKIVAITPRARYYNHEDPAEDGNHGWSLLAEIKAQMTAQLTGTYEFADGTPSGSDLPGSGLRFFRQDAGDFAFAFGSADWTFDKRLLGFRADNTGSSGLLDNETSPVSVWGEWISANEIDGAASRKDKTYDKYTAHSSDRAPSASTRRYYNDLRRQIVYEFVAGAHVREDRAKDGTSAATAGLPTGDVHNAIEGMFDLFTAPTADADIPRVIIVHGGGRYGIRENIFNDEPYEIAQLAPIDDQLSQPGALFEVTRMAGEYYTVSWIWHIIEGTYDQ